MARRPPVFQIVLPGILLAATGVGAGDLLTSALGGSEAGLAVLWAAVVGAALKWTLTEGLARWQLATGTTLLEGWVWRLGRPMQWVFLAYLALFSLAVGGALITACGVAGATLLPLGDPETSKRVWGMAHSLAGCALVWFGTFAAFEKLMSVLVGVMFVTVVSTAFALAPDWGAMAAGFVPQIPPGQTSWVLAVLGGVGGTMTLLSYGYWIRERGRQGREDVPVCRLDLAVGNGITALFGVCVIIIGSRVALQDQGLSLAAEMAAQLELAIGPAGRWLFLLGFWAAVFSSLLGVWQSVPYYFADFLSIRRYREAQAAREVDFRATPAYRGYLLGLAFVPAIFLWTTVRQIQLAYGIIGAFFLPLLALSLLILNTRRRWIGDEFASPWWINAILVAALTLFGYLGAREAMEWLGGG